MAIVAVVFILIFAALFLAFATDNNKLDQSGSPNTTDSSSPNPSANNSTLLSGQASAQVIVTIHSTHLIFDVQYHRFQNTDQMAEGDIAAHSSVIHMITLVFPENQTGLYKAAILATSNEVALGLERSGNRRSSEWRNVSGHPEHIRCQ